MKKIILLFLLGAILFSPIFGQTDFPEISSAELENVDYTVIYEDSNNNYKIIVIDGITYIFYYWDNGG